MVYAKYNFNSHANCVTNWQKSIKLLNFKNDYALIGIILCSEWGDSDEGIVPKYRHLPKGRHEKGSAVSSPSPAREDGGEPKFFQVQFKSRVSTLR